MSWIDRINAAIVGRIRGKAALVADAEGLEASGRRLHYSNLQRAVAYRHPSLIGDDLAVALDFGESRVVVVSENRRRVEHRARRAGRARSQSASFDRVAACLGCWLARGSNRAARLT